MVEFQDAPDEINRMSKYLRFVVVSFFFGACLPAVTLPIFFKYPPQSDALHTFNHSDDNR